jgi:AcrR family transcriptional regulator
MCANKPNFSTTERLLEAAGELFADKGFDGTSVRDISERAKTNVAAINYHFHDKQGLYEETVLYAFNYMDREMPLCLEGLAPNEQLRLFIKKKLIGFLGHDRPSWHLRLIHEERKNPSESFMKKIGSLLDDRLNRLARIIAAVTRRKENDEEVHLYAFSVIGQCLFFARHDHFGKNNPVAKYCKTADIDMLTDYIYSFSIAGMTSDKERNRKDD